MKTVIRTKKIKGIDYLYEITYYYDKASKRTRQHSKYLGKSVDGKPVKVREISGVPKMALNYGEFLPCFATAEAYNLKNQLGHSLTEKEVNAVLTLAFNRVLRPLAMNQIGSWYEGTILSAKYPDTPLSSQYLSNLLVKIGQEGIPFKFFQDLITDLSPLNTLYYDITSISSYTSAISFFEYGHNRDGVRLPQVNVSLVVDKERGIPIFYDMYPGSIVDVSTLKNTLTKIETLGISGSTLIMDRGFCSGANLKALTKHQLPFIMPVSRTFKVVKQTLSAIQSTIKRINNLQSFNDKALFVEPLSLTIEGIQFKGYGYYSPSREQDDRERFYQKLREVITSLEKIELKPKMKPASIFLKHADKCSTYLSWDVVDDRFAITVKEDAVSQRVNSMGLFILIYKGDFRWDECISLYRSRELVELAFDIIKNDLEIMPINVKKRESLLGLLFISFLSLLIRMHILRQLQTTGLLKKCSFSRLILELEKIRWFVLPDGKFLITEIGKKQRGILDTLSLSPDVKNFVTS
jgi:transposase